MDRKIWEAFGEIRAGEDLKESTLAYVAQKTGGFQGKKPRPLARRLAAAACSLLVVAGAGLLGGWVYYTPTAAIQVGVTPPVELSVNRFGRVIGTGEGTAAQELEHQPYAQAVEALVEQAGQEELSIAVAGEDEGQCREILAQVEDCAGGRRLHPGQRGGGGGRPGGRSALWEVPGLSGAAGAGPQPHPRGRGGHDHAGDPGVD